MNREHLYFGKLRIYILLCFNNNNANIDLIRHIPISFRLLFKVELSFKREKNKHTLLVPVQKKLLSSFHFVTNYYYKMMMVSLECVCVFVFLVFHYNNICKLHQRWNKISEENSSNSKLQ